MSAAQASRPTASLSIDLDNLWAYQRSKGDVRWRDYSSFLPRAVPRVHTLLDALAIKLTAFVVGADAERRENCDALRSLVDAGHEIGNHSYAHDSGFHALDETALAEDFDRAETALTSLGAPVPNGFRGPSFRLSTTVLRCLLARGYRYDASTFPTSLGPLARTWQRVWFKLDDEARAALRGQYGGFTDARRPLTPYLWRVDLRELLEIPVTTMPFTRLPVHWTYVHFLAGMSPSLALAYVRSTIALCRARGIAPSLLLHATDFIGADDPECPRFLPGMRHTQAAKTALLRRTLTMYQEAFELLPLGVCAERLLARGVSDIHSPHEAGLA